MNRWWELLGGDGLGRKGENGPAVFVFEVCEGHIPPTHANEFRLGNGLGAQSDGIAHDRRRLGCDELFSIRRRLEPWLLRRAEGGVRFFS
mgnify:CR=1 FL=1